MGRMLVIIVAVMVVVLGITTQQVLNSNVNSATGTFVRLNETKAKKLAESGMEIALAKLSEDDSWRGLQGTQFGDGVIKVDVVDYYGNFLPRTGAKPNWDRWVDYASTLSQSDGTHGYLVRSQGVVEGVTTSGYAVVQHTQATIEPPKYFDYALFVNGSWTANGNSHVVADDNSLNANVHVNESGHFNGVKKNNPLVEGFFTYSGSKPTWNPWKTDPGDFLMPNHNPDGKEVLRKVSKIDLPEFNPDDYKDIATQVYETNLNLSGNQTYGTKMNPEIIFVGGDLKISGSITGYAVFIVKTNAMISGNVTLNNGDPNQSNLAFYTGGDLILNGTPQVHGQCYVKGNLVMNGTPDIYGQVIIDGDFTQNGNGLVHYHPANPQLVKDVFPCEGKESGIVETISYFE